MDRGQHHERIELLDHHLSTAVRQTVHRSQHHTEAVEQGHTDTKLVFRSKAHILTCEKAIISNTIVSEHDALGEARSTRGVLHVAHIVAVDVLLHLFKRLVLDILSEEQQLSRVVHAAIFLHADVNHVLQIGEAFAVQMATLAGLQLGQHGVGHIDIVTVPRSVGDAKNLHVGVFAQILQLVLLVVGVHRYQHGTNLSCGIEEGEPVRNIRRPDAYVRAFLHTNGYQALGQVVNTLVELAPCEAKVAV